MEDKRNAKLSKAVLEMKFMKKTKERVEREEDNEEGHAMYSKEITEEMRRTGNIMFVETSIVNCKDLIEGRLSFGGMNPEIEKIMVKDMEYAKRLKETEKQKEKDISDIEMAKGYSTLVDTMAKKSHGKRHKRINQNKFLKPADD